MSQDSCSPGNPLKMGLKDFIMDTLAKYNCHANLEFLADYIIGLRLNGIEEAQDFVHNLEDFLHESTEPFVAELIYYLDTNIIYGIDNDSMPKNVITVSESEVEVDYEEESCSNESIKVVPCCRVLREYSPERGGSEQTTSKKPCSNYSKKGICRFGDGCRFAHIEPEPRRKNANVSNRIRVKNLPISDLLNPAYLTHLMSKYGDVINMTVYPENHEAMIQFATGEQAMRAAKRAAKEDFQNGVVVELETPKASVSIPNGFKAKINRTLKSQKESQKESQKDYYHHHQNQHPHSPATNEKLQSLIALQKQQQTLLETNLSCQQTLLNHLQSANLSAAERTELVASLNKIQGSVMSVQEMLKRTTELVVEAASKSSLSAQSPAQSPAPLSHRNYNARQFGNNTYIPGKPSKPINTSSSTAAAAVMVNRPPGSNKLDLRPTTLKLSSLKSTPLPDIHALQRRFAPYGQLQSLVIVDKGEAALIKYQRHEDAKKAMEKEVEMDIELIKQ